MLRVIKQTHDEKVSMYMELEKEEITGMLVESNEVLYTTLQTLTATSKTHDMLLNALKNQYQLTKDVAVAISTDKFNAVRERWNKVMNETEDLILQLSPNGINP
jgi:hypothetical protein